MGQAFDSDGNVLGEEEGATKREVFEKLNTQFKDAAEIRIKSLTAGPARSAAEHVDALEHMARYRREGRTGTRSVADLAEAESCAAGAQAIRELMEIDRILERIGKRG